MKLVTFSCQEDFGTDIRLILLRFRSFSLLEIWTSTSIFARKRPDFHLTIEFLTHTLFSIGISAWAISFQLKILSFYHTFTLDRTP